jgi:transcriptional regulator with XRE-family HTH domain
MTASGSMGITNAYAGETLRQRVKRLRLAKKMSQQHLAILCGYADKMPIYKLESGITKRTPDALTLSAMASALGVSTQYLLSGTEAAPSPQMTPRSPGLTQLLESGRPLRQGTKRALFGSDELGLDWTLQQWTDVADIFEAHAAASEARARLDEPPGKKPTKPSGQKKPKR